MADGLTVDPEAAEAFRQAALGAEILDAHRRGDWAHARRLLVVRPTDSALGLIQVAALLGSLLGEDAWATLLARLQTAGAVAEVFEGLEVSHGG